MAGVAGNELMESSEPSRASIIQLYLPLLVYLLIALPVGFATRERFNSDGVCYLHRAILLTRGDLSDSISGYWSPGLTWSVVPFLWLGVDPLHAIHLALLLWGAAFVVAAQCFFRSIVPCKPLWVLAGGIAIAPTALRLATPTITPDLLLGALLLFYLALIPKHPGLAGLGAGLAFLGKAYALPFFLVHFLMTVLLRRLGWRSLALGYLAFALIAGPWIGVLSWKYGRFTFSTAATRNRFMQDVAPPDVRIHPPDVSRVPPGPFLTNMEVTDSDAWPSWSPLDNAEHFKHQVHIAVEHLGELVADVWRFDYIGFALAAFLMALLLRDRISIWLQLTGCIYAGGLLLVVYETRYALPVLLPIGLGLCLHVCEEWQQKRGSRAFHVTRPSRPCQQQGSIGDPQDRKGIDTLGFQHGRDAHVTNENPGLTILALIIAICVAGSGAWGIYSALTAPHPAINDRQVARLVTDSGLNGMFASNTANRDRASCVAFFLNQKFIALPLDVDAKILQSKLDSDGVRFLYRWFDPNYADSADWPEPQMRLLMDDGDWVKKRSIHLDSRRRLDIYERNEGGAKPGNSTTRLGK